MLTVYMNVKTYIEKECLLRGQKMTLRILISENFDTGQGELALGEEPWKMRECFALFLYEIFNHSRKTIPFRKGVQRILFSVGKGRVSPRDFFNNQFENGAFSSHEI